MNEVVREFLLETHENLAQLDLDLVRLEKDPAEKETLARVFRTLHTVKGTAGFLGLPKLQAVAHAAENLLSRLRAGELLFNREIASALLGSVDAVRRMLDALEKTSAEGSGDFTAVIATLDRLRGASSPGPARPAAPTPPPPAPAPQPVPAPPPATTQTMVTKRPDAPARPPSTPAPPPAAPAVPPPRPPEEPPRVSFVGSPSFVGRAEGGPESGEARASAVSDSAIRVDVGLLDKLMTLVGELVLARNQIMQFSTSQEDTGFLGTVQRLNLLTTELQGQVMKTRMQPIGNLWSKFPRVVRDLAVACGKQVRLDMAGKETELDKTIVEAVRDPLTHIVRNAVDHGIEPPDVRLSRGKPAEGSLALAAHHEGGKVIIQITDDGGGIDPARVRDKAVHQKLITPEQADRLTPRELVNLIFLPGFSTADRISHFSGRGVGMDVVRTNVEKIGGSVEVESTAGRGTSVKMKIPLTLAIIPALTVTSGGDRYAIPQVSLLELVRLEAEQAGRAVEQMHGAPVYRLRGNLLPLVYLDRELGVGRDRAGDGAVNIVVLQADDRQFGLVVDAIHDTEEIVVKPLQKQLKGIPVFSGATIMGDGRVALILDVLGLAQRANVVAGGRDRPAAEKAVVAAAEDRVAVLLCAAPGGARMAVPLAQVARLEEFPRAAVERAGALEVVQYRGEILPLIRVGRVLGRAAAGNTGPRRNGRGSPAATTADRPVPVVVFATGGRQAGLVVGKILDIVEEAVPVRARASRPGVLFNAVVQGEVTEFLDVEAIIRAAVPDFFDRPPATAAPRPGRPT